MCAHQVCGFSFVCFGIHGTSTSTSNPTSASAMFGIMPAKQGDAREMLR